MDSAFTSKIYFERKIPVSNLSECELHALENLTISNDLVIQKANKGNSVVIINKKDYKTKITDILSDFTKFKKLEIDESKQLNFYSSVMRNSKISLHLYI